MTWHFLRFELRYWMRGMMVWVFLFILGAMFFGAASTDKVQVGRALENTFRNAPYVIQTFHAMASILVMVMVTAFVNSAASRDFQYNTHQIVFSTPIRKRDYLLGRFLGSAIVAMIPLLGVSLAILLAKYMPWVDAERWGPVVWNAHLNGFLLFGIPNTLFIAAIIFCIAALTRSTITSFIGTLLLLVAYSVAGVYMEDIDNEVVAKLVDPFGIQTHSLLTKYWTVSEKNTQVITLSGFMLWNRLIWLGVAALVFVFTYYRFRFEERQSKKKKAAAAEPDVRPRKTAVIPAAAQSFGMAAQFTQLLSQTRVEFWGLVKSTVFVVILVAALINCIPALVISTNEGFGLSSLPVTYRILDVIRGSMYIFLVAIVTYFAGVVVWRERESRCDEIHDALPYPNWIPYVAKFVALVGALVLILSTAMAAGVATQAYQKYTRFQFDLYFTEIFLLDLSLFVSLAFLAFLIHVLSSNKYVGYFAFIIFMIANGFIWRPLDIATRMVRFPSTPGYTYSDLYGYAPYREAMFWFHVYWLLFCGLLAVAAVLLWARGKETSLRSRLRNARQNLRGALRPIAVGLATAWIASAGWVYYNTKVLNGYQTEKEGLAQQAQYEKSYKRLKGVNQPRILGLKYWIDVYPEERNLVLRTEQIAENKGSGPIERVYVNYSRGYEYEVAIERATLESDDAFVRLRTYKLSPPLQPGERITMKYKVEAITRGFEQSVTHSNLVQNGTFFNSGIVPSMGYQAGREISDRNERRKRGLPEQDRMPELERNCTARCTNTYLDANSDWVSVETVMSTSPDQFAVAPGSLQREWQENGRRYFHYKLDRDSLNFYSFISARYEVAREDAAGVKAEVYYHPEHKWNVPKMLTSIRKTLEYCTKNFGPYAHKQARIIEFPRFSSFAQAFPGTMPYSESIGFIADIKDKDDIDKVFYIVAHEMGHQWWAHQVIGANMQGATLLSETLAQYTALMVMEKEYGRDMMRKFLGYEMDRYLRSRGTELLKERPLLKVESSQGYIHYNKGSAVLYYLKEMIGEEAVNQALRKTIEQWAYKGPPYPTSHHLVDAFRAVTPADKQYLLQDLFEDITLFANRTMLASAKKRADGQFDVTIEVETRKLKADDKGFEKEVAINDWVDIGAFAKPEKGKKYGRTLHRERVRITAAKNKFTFTVKELPEKAGVDPFQLLVDRIPDDNMKKVAVSD
ncbi:MAG: ABC-2 transporter permease [Bryobacterales bacterium]|nr:ABC-2 transporter permease [Bryobacterales bacterium]